MGYRGTRRTTKGKDKTKKNPNENISNSKVNHFQLSRKIYITYDNKDNNNQVI